MGPKVVAMQLVWAQGSELEGEEISSVLSHVQTHLDIARVYGGQVSGVS